MEHLKFRSGVNNPLVKDKYLCYCNFSQVGSVGGLVLSLHFSIRLNILAQTPHRAQEFNY